MEDEDYSEPTQRTQRIAGVEIDIEGVKAQLRREAKKSSFWFQVIGGGLLAAFLAGIGVPAYIEKVAHTEEVDVLKNRMTIIETRLNDILDTLRHKEK